MLAWHSMLLAHTCSDGSAHRMLYYYSDIETQKYYFLQDFFLLIGRVVFFLVTKGEGRSV